MKAGGYHLVDQILIPHASFNAAKKRIVQCLKIADGTCAPICIAVIGESRTGKTRILEHIAKQYPSRRLDDGLHITVLRVSTPSVPTIKGLAEEILSCIGDPLPGKGTVNNMTSRIVTQVRECGIRMIMVDEFQHFYNKERNKIMHNVADWLKVLVDRCKIALVVCGLPSCQAVLNQNEQLAGRFMAPIFMKRFDWEDKDQKDEFVSILESFQTGLSQFDIPKLDSDEMSFRFHCATGGLMGFVVKILRQAVWNAIDSNTHIISLEDLNRAYQDSVYKDIASSDLPNAFDKDFTLHASEELLARVKKIGIAEEEKEAKTSRKRKSLKVGEILSA